MGTVILEGVNGFLVHYTLRKVPETAVLINIGERL